MPSFPSILLFHFGAIDFINLYRQRFHQAPLTGNGRNLCEVLLPLNDLFRMIEGANYWLSPSLLLFPH